MLIASIVVVAIFLIFIITTYVMTIKNITFDIEGNKLKIHNQGSKLKIFVNDKEVLKADMPQLIKGETYEIEIDKKLYTIKCLCNSFGNKMRVEVFQGENFIADNGIEIKRRKSQQIN